MSLAQPQAPERRVSPVPPLNAPTNNPFRRGAGSPQLSPAIRSESPSMRPPSNNPFLDNPFEMNATETRPAQMSPPKPASRRPVTRPGENEALLKGLTLEDKPAGENLPPPVRSRHHPSQSTESNSRRPDQSETLDIFADPPTRRQRPDRRPRRNSESSVADRKSTDEDKRHRERRHRERPKDSQGRPIPSSNGKSKKPSRRLDVIDKLDVTSIYGTGLFHHDGPFDALNPHRNRKGSNRAPMQAFPKDSMNNVLGGSGPVNKNIDLNRVHGHQEDSFSDFNTGRALKESANQGYEQYIGPGVRPRGSSKSGPMIDRTSSFNPGSKVDPLHGDESLGLGTSTFFEGTPAARAELQRRESEGEVATLTRKKSLAQKIRGMNNRPRRYENGEYTSPDRYERTTSPEALSGGGANGLPKINERNPFFQNYDDEYEKKGASIRVAEQRNTEGESSRVAPAPLTRSVTEGSFSGDHLAPEGENKSSGGFLNRVKSLRGGGRGRPRPREA